MAPIKLKTRIRRNSGFTFIELMVAAVVMTIGLMGLINLWIFSFQVTTNTDYTGISYNLGRQAVERTKMLGFANAPEGTSTTYYDGDQNQVGSGSGSAVYKVTTSIVSDSVQSGSPGQPGAVPSDTALRTVTVTVTVISTGKVVYQTNTYLARGGI
ncbi:MAG: prepilin-type N-terminal cleavage/methylation domain-containing protein [Armatimonadetes bacterium]|nr:prepilin-type N-terminal cleavage/methylation domain-containing protein [Armatimonadota bacterium]